MSSLRYNIITGETVIISENRAKRPFDINKDKRDISKCPFCPGNEENAPPHLFSKGTPWTIRVVPNKYPAVNNDFTEDESGLFHREKVTGKHFVIIDSDKHYNYLNNMTAEEIKLLLYTYSWVMKELYKDPVTSYVQIFKNYKKEGGASLEHTHSQAVSLSFVPEKLQSMLHNSLEYHKEKKQCLFCDLMAMELEKKERVIHETHHFVAFAPYASLLPYEFSIYPKKHSSCFYNISEEQYADLALLIKELMNRLFSKLNNPAYNLYINSVKDEHAFYHWSIRIIPRTAIQAGFEQSTGVLLNSISPESTKAILTP
jgi:UDPglucose--hexose-1-phosphate uridylyltransferase